VFSILSGYLRYTHISNLNNSISIRYVKDASLPGKYRAKAFI